MKVAFSTGRPAHVELPANLLVERGVEVTLYTAAPRSRFRQLSPDVCLHWVPQFVPSLHFLTGVQMPRPFQRIDTILYDRMVSLRMREFDFFWGWASGALFSGRATRRKGARFVLDRACPHVDVQQALVREESGRLGVSYKGEPRWFHDRQIAEYEEADCIVVPSEYSRRSFPPGLQSKVIVAPLSGRVPAGVSHVVSSKTAAHRTESATGIFVVGFVGGQLLRKGFLDLLLAWERLHLPNARLRLRTDARLDSSPVLRELLHRLPNIEIVGHLSDMSAFYQSCDAFVLPTLDDGFGMALLEAMAHGVPSITTTHCGAAELFIAGEDLLVVPARNPDALTEAIASLHASRDLHQSLSQHGRAAVAALEAGGMFSRYSNALDRVLASSSVPK